MAKKLKNYGNITLPEKERILVRADEMHRLEDAILHSETKLTELRSQWAALKRQPQPDHTVPDELTNWFKLAGDIRQAMYEHEWAEPADAAEMVESVQKIMAGYKHVGALEIAAAVESYAEFIQRMVSTHYLPQLKVTCTYIINGNDHVMFVCQIEMEETAHA